MTTIDANLALHLWEIFPDAFSTTKTAPTYDTFNGPWGTEEVQTGETRVVLAECILMTANALSHGDEERALRYLGGFKPAWVQRREIRNFLR